MQSPSFRSAWLLQGHRLRVAAGALCVAWAASFLVLFVVLSGRGDAEAVAESRGDVAGVAASIAEQLSRTFDATDIVLLEVGSQFTAGLTPWEADRIAMRLRQMPQLRALLVADEQGVVRFATTEALVGTQLSDRSWMGAAAGADLRLVIGQPEPGRFLGTPGQTIQAARRWTIPLARRVRGTEEWSAGTAIALFNPDYLVEIGQRAAASFDVTVQFLGLDGTLLASSSGSADGIGQADPGAWLFRDFLPRVAQGTQEGRDSRGADGVAGFAVTSTGLMAVEVSRHRMRVLEPARHHALELGIGIAVVAASTLSAVLMLAFVGLRAARQQALAQTAAQEAALLRAGRAETERLLGALPTVVFHATLGRNGSVHYRRIGGDIAAVTGWPPATLQTSEAWEALGDPEAGAFDDFVRRAAEAGRATREARLRQPDGSWRWLRNEAVVLQTDAAGTVEIVGHTSDVTAERVARARLAAAGRLASLGEMASGLAHELRQPLTIMSLAAQNLVRGLQAGRTEGLRARADRIVEQAGRAGAIIEHLRRFARGSEEQAPLVPVRLEDAVDGALTLVGGSLRDAGVLQEIDLGMPAPVVMGQLVAIEQVLVNLLMNACHAMEARSALDGRRIRVVAHADMAAGVARLTVEDSGGGIAPQVMARMFEPFVTTKGPDKGTGLGLSICHGLMTGMGGAIGAHNTGEGAAFELTFALAGEADAALPAAS